jgi:hypothetical protein
MSLLDELIQSSTPIVNMGAIWLRFRLTVCGESSRQVATGISKAWGRIQSDPNEIAPTHLIFYFGLSENAEQKASCLRNAPKLGITRLITRSIFPHISHWFI